MKKFIGLMVFLGLLVTSYSAFATTYIVGNTRIYVFAQSRLESTANLIQFEAPMFNGGNHPWCVNRAYIRFEDKELFAAALAASVAGKAINVMYEDAAVSKVAAGHSQLTCKVVSIWL